MFKDLKSKILQKTVERKLKDLPPEQQNMISSMLEKNPELFEKIQKEIKAKTKAGQGEMSASMEVMRKYQSEIQKILKN